MLIVDTHYVFCVESENATLESEHNFSMRKMNRLLVKIK